MASSIISIEFALEAFAIYFFSFLPYKQKKERFPSPNFYSSSSIISRRVFLFFLLVETFS
jgi:hypothetical protein